MYTPAYFGSVLDQAIPVTLAARSFIIPIPKGIGSPAIYPYDIFGDDGEVLFKKGEPILNKNSQQKHGIVFTNYTDGAIQIANDDGTEMIILNAISKEQGRLLLEFYKKTIPSPEFAIEKAIHKVLNYAYETLHIKDRYDGHMESIGSFDVVDPHPENPQCGTFIRRNDQKRFALVGIGSGTYEGPAGSPQRFEGKVVVLTNGKRTWLVQAEEFLNTYQHADGRKIELKDLPAFAMNGQTPQQAARLETLG